MTKAIAAIETVKEDDEDGAVLHGESKGRGTNWNKLGMPAYEHALRWYFNGVRGSIGEAKPVVLTRRDYPISILRKPLGSKLSHRPALREVDGNTL